MSTVYETLQNELAEAVQNFASFRKQHKLYYSRSRTPEETSFIAIYMETHKGMDEIREEIENVVKAFIELIEKYCFKTKEASETYAMNSESAKLEDLKLQMKISSMSAEPTPNSSGAISDKRVSIV
jgi:hypothetical protein